MSNLKVIDIRYLLYYLLLKRRFSSAEVPMGSVSSLPDREMLSAFSPGASVRNKHHHTLRFTEPAAWKSMRLTRTSRSDTARARSIGSAPGNSFLVDGTRRSYSTTGVDVGVVALGAATAPTAVLGSRRQLAPRRAMLSCLPFRCVCYTAWCRVLSISFPVHSSACLLNCLPLVLLSSSGPRISCNRGVTRLALQLRVAHPSI